MRGLNNSQASQPIKMVGVKPLQKRVVKPLLMVWTVDEQPVYSQSLCFPLNYKDF